MRHREAALSVVIPTRNERANIHPLLSSLSKALEGIATEIIIVDDSDDDTPAVVEREACLLPDTIQMHLIHRKPGQDRQGGLATAVSTGLQHATARYFAVIDADLQHPPERLRVLYDEAIAADADVVMATRYREGGSYDGLDGVSRRIISVGLKWVAKLVFPDQLMRVSDPLGGFFLVRRSLISGVTLRPIGYKISLELLIRCSWARLVEVPYHFQARAGGESKSDIKQGIMVFQHMLRLVREVPAAARFWKFCAVGAIGVALNISLFLLTLRLSVPLWQAWGLVTETTIVFNFLLHSLLTWGDKRTTTLTGWVSRTLKYHLAVVPSILLNLIVFKLGLTVLHHPVGSQVTGIAAGVILSYSLARRVVFAPREEWHEILFARHARPAEETESIKGALTPVSL